jgi:hypothetical protein
MIALAKFKQFVPLEIPVNLDKLIGDGVDGEVYSLLYETNKVVKFSFNIDNNQSDSDFIYSLIAKPNNILVKLYVYKYLGPFINENIRYYLSFYMMEKLNSISEDEWKVFHTLLSHEDRNAKKQFSEIELKEILEGLKLGLDFDEEKVIFFCNSINNLDFVHPDIHPRNIMKDNFGSFKLIDLDRIKK